MRGHILVIVLQLAAAGNDAYWTNRNMHLTPRHEANPLARQFVGSAPGCAAYFGATTALHLALPALLRRREHGRLARLAEWEGIADNGVSGAYSAAHSKGKR